MNTKEIKFNHSAEEGIHVSKGELIECNGVQYALHYYQGFYDAIELSTGFRVAGVDMNTQTIDGIPARDYLIQQIEKRKITVTVLERAKREMFVRDIKFPVNQKFNK